MGSMAPTTMAGSGLETIEQRLSRSATELCWVLDVFCRVCSGKDLPQFVRIWQRGLLSPANSFQPEVAGQRPFSELVEALLLSPERTSAVSATRHDVTNQIPWRGALESTKGQETPQRVLQGGGGAWILLAIPDKATNNELISLLRGGDITNQYMDILFVASFVIFNPRGYVTWMG